MVLSERKRRNESVLIEENPIKKKNSNQLQNK
jgi:hypothetical protein